MERNDKLEAIAGRFLEAFRTGNLPARVAPLFFSAPSEAIPCHRWSVRNRTIALLEGFDDARGFRQWLEVGRHVKEGESAFYILNPILPRRADDDSAEESKPKGEERHPAPRQPRGFRFQAVFGYDQTDGEPLPIYEERRRKVEALPLLEVAQSWGLQVRALSGTQEAGYLGRYRHGELIALGVENPATWAHELIHAAEDRLGILKREDRSDEDKLEQEIVAEFGGAILLEQLGRSKDADLGGCYRYLKHHCETAGAVLAACDRLLKRTLGAVTLILDTADELAARSSAA